MITYNDRSTILRLSKSNIQVTDHIFLSQNSEITATSFKAGNLQIQDSNITADMIAVTTVFLQKSKIFGRGSLDTSSLITDQSDLGEKIPRKFSRSDNSLKIHRNFFVQCNYCLDEKFENFSNSNHIKYCEFTSSIRGEFPARIFGEISDPSQISADSIICDEMILNSSNIQIGGNVVVSKTLEMTDKSVYGELFFRIFMRLFYRFIHENKTRFFVKNIINRLNFITRKFVKKDTEYVLVVR